MNEHTVCYLHPDGHSYVAMDEDGEWWTWAAVEGGWLSKRKCPATLVDQCEELDTFHGDLALRLSGVML